MRPLVATTGAHIYTSEGYMQNLLWQVYMDGVYDNGGLPFLVTDIDQPSAAQLARQKPTDSLYLAVWMFLLVATRRNARHCADRRTAKETI